MKPHKTQKMHKQQTLLQYSAWTFGIKEAANFKEPVLYVCLEKDK